MNLIIGIVVVLGCVLGGFVVHGGHIGANPNPAGGTTFRFTLRAVTQEEVRDAV